MIEKYFTILELAEILNVPSDAVRDFLAGDAEFTKHDVDGLLEKLAEKARAGKPND